MTTTTAALIDRTARRDRTAVAVGSAPFVLSILLAIATLAAVVASLLARDALRGPAVSIGSLQGTALVLLVVTLPVLALSMVLVGRGFGAAVIGWFGALGSIMYQGVLLLFGTPFNAFFFLYVAMLSLAFWAIVALGATIPVSRLARHVGSNAPVRTIAAYLLVNAMLFLGLWLRQRSPRSSAPPRPPFSTARV